MRLYLSSFRVGNHPQKLIDLVSENKNAAVIINACDHLTKEDREIRVRQEFTALEGLGFKPTELDLRNYFTGNHEELFAFLETYGLVWVRGGNPFILIKAFKFSGFDNIIKDFLKRDVIVYGGFSAGPCVLAPSLKGGELVDHPNLFPEGYTTDIIWDGLSILPYALAPHYKSDHPESDDIDKLIKYYIENKIIFKALHDGEVIVIEGDSEQVYK